MNSSARRVARCASIVNWGSAHPGVTLWDFVDARGLDPNDPAVDQAYAWALADYRKALAEYRAKKADIAVDDVELVRS